MCSSDLEALSGDEGGEGALLIAQRPVIGEADAEVDVERRGELPVVVDPGVKGVLDVVALELAADDLGAAVGAGVAGEEIGHGLEVAAVIEADGERAGVTRRTWHARREARRGVRNRDRDEGVAGRPVGRQPVTQPMYPSHERGGAIRLRAS